MVKERIAIVRREAKRGIQPRTTGVRQSVRSYDGSSRVLTAVDTVCIGSDRVDPWEFPKAQGEPQEELRISPSLAWLHLSDGHSGFAAR